MQFATTGLERMRIDASGNVGIGTVSPTAKLEVNGGDGYFYNTASYGGIRIGFNGTGTNYWDIKRENVSTGRLAFFSGTSERMAITPGGNVGIGTTSPSAVLETFGGTSFIGAKFKGYSGGKTALIGGDLDAVWFGDDDGSIGGTNSFNILGASNVARIVTNSSERMRIQSNGEVEISGIGNTSGARLNIGSDANNAFVRSYDTAAGIVIGTTNAHPVKFMSNSSERMRIDSSGTLLVAKTSTGIATVGVELRSDTIYSTSESIPLYLNRKGSSGTILEFRTNNGTSGTVYSTTGSVTYNTSSDYRLKENIQPLENGLERLNNLKPVKFDWKENGKSSEGFIAHEAQEVFPDAVTGEKDGEDMQGMDYGRITPLLVKAIQEQQAQIDALQSEINELKNS